MEEFLNLELDTDLNQYFEQWIKGIKDPQESKAATGMILPRLQKEVDSKRGNEILKEIYDRKDYLIKKISMGIRRRRLGIRHRIRRPRPRTSIRRRHKRTSNGHRSILQHRRSILKSNPNSSRSKIRSLRKENKEKKT